jgi:putative membrane protein
MLGFLLRWSINLVALVAAGVYVNGVRIQSVSAGILAAGILGIVNAVIRPVVLIFTFPINLLTLGLFTLVINAAMLKIVAALVPGFIVETFGAAFFAALLISIISWLLNIFVSGSGKVVFIKTVRKDEGGG